MRCCWSNDFPVNVFAAEVGVTPEEAGAGWRLEVVGATANLRYTRAELLALPRHSADLSLDHGFPAPIIVPNNPGVRNTKWVRRLSFEV